MSLSSSVGGVHHYDENGLRDPADEPPHIQKIHRDIVEFVSEWLKEWKPVNATTSANSGHVDSAL